MGVLNIMLSTSYIYAQAKIQRLEISGLAQGTTYNIAYFNSKVTIEKEEIEFLLKEIDSSLSLYQPTSLISQFNASEKGVQIDKHFKRVFLSAKRAYFKSNKLFDPTVAPLVELWGFGKSKHGTTIVSSDEIKMAQLKMGFEEIRMQYPYLSKSRSQIQLDFNGIAQGYTVDVICKYLNQKGIKSYIVELGGEVRVKGKKPDGSNYKVGIEAPEKYKFNSHVVSINKGAITGSGIYIQGRMYQGHWISHIINPQTGYPVQSTVLSATVYAKHAIWADAYDQVFLAMHPNEALQFAQRKLKIGLLIYYLDQQGDIQAIYNRRFQKILIN